LANTALHNTFTVVKVKGQALKCRYNPKKPAEVLHFRHGVKPKDASGESLARFFYEKNKNLI